jgi:hypothetical protein
MTSGARRWLGRGALLGCSTIASLACAEIAVRVMGREPERYAHPWHIETPDKRVGLDVYPDNPGGYFSIDLRRPEERTLWRDRGLTQVDDRWQRTPFAVGFRYTAELCRGDAIAPRTAGRARVVVIGDSFTEGQGVREEDTFVSVLGRSLVPAELLDCGRRGYDFPELRQLFDRNLVLEPDVVVYAMILNDPQQSPAFHEHYPYLNDWILERRRMVMQDEPRPQRTFWESRLMALIGERREAARVAHESTRWYQGIVGEPNREGWQATLTHLSEMDQAMRARGGKLVVVLWPLLIDLDGDYPFEVAHRTIRDALEARHITFHDTLPAFRGHDAKSLWVHPTDRHANARAHAMFAHEIEATVRSALSENALPH